VSLSNLVCSRAASARLNFFFAHRVCTTRKQPRSRLLRACTCSLKAGNHPTEMAESMLSALEGSLRAFERHRQLILGLRQDALVRLTLSDHPQRALCKRSGGSAKNDLQCQDRERTAHNRSQRSTTGSSQPRTHDLGPQRRSHRHGQPRSDSPRTTIPACMAPNDDWGRVCA
jgi:hypothetical protein